MSFATFTLNFVGVITLEKIIYHPKIGDVRYIKSTRAKRISIAVRLLKGVVVTVPNHTSYADAEHFVDSKCEWILKSKKKIEQVEQQQTVFTLDNEYRTKFRTLKLIPEVRKNLRLHVSNEYIEIYYPQQLPVTHEGVQNAIRQAMEHTWRIEAHEYLPNRLSTLAQQFGFTFKKVLIKNTRSSWGSCSFDDTISLSLHLMHLPDELIDYVLLHELCHTIHKNHGAGFWALLDRVTKGQAKQLAKLMQKYSTRVY